MWPASHLRLGYRKKDGRRIHPGPSKNRRRILLSLPLSQCGVVSILQIRGHVFKGHFLKYTSFVTAIYVPMFSVFFPSKFDASLPASLRLPVSFQETR